MQNAFSMLISVFTGTNAIFGAAFGVLWGIIGGALPGISPSIAMALILPLTYTMQPVVAVIVLASVYVGAEYGGSIPAILIATPGTNSAGATVIDGYQMQLQGKGGEALGISLQSGFIGGMVGLFFLVTLTGWLSKIALMFTPAAYFAIGIMGLSVISSLSEENLLKGLIPGVLGLMIATVGNDPISGVNRFTFGSVNLLQGFGPIVIMIGLFAVAELLKQSGSASWPKARNDTKIIMPSFKLWRTRLMIPHIIGSIIGTIEGIIPGAGGTVAAFMSLNEAKRWSKHKEEFGHGSIEGVAAPECANNVVTATALIPLLSFGIPGSNSAAVLLGGMLLHGLRPGPMLYISNLEIVYGLYGGLFFANILMVVIGLISLKGALWLVNRPMPYVIAVVFVLIFSGAYSLNQSLFEPAVVLFVGAIGFLMRYVGFSPLPMVLGVVLGFMVETNYRRALELSAGDYMVFVGDPISIILLSIAFIFIAVSLFRVLKSKVGKKGKTSI